MYRPSGLTALAVFNFVIGGFGAIRALLTLALLSGAVQPQDGARAPSETLLGVQLLYLVLDSALLIVSGVGYLKLKRFLGRWLGTADAVVSLVFFGVIIALVQREGAPFSISSLTMLVYPGLTLVLLNVVFREDLVH